MIIKEITFDNDTNLLWLVDNKGGKYKCNIYGKKVKQYHNRVTGLASATERKSHGKEYFDAVPSLTTEGLDYYPTTKKFECYSQFPRPLVRPMSNHDYTKKNERLRNELVAILQLNYKSEKAKKAFSDNANKTVINTLTFNTSHLAKEENYMIDTKNLLDLIDNTFKVMFNKKEQWEIDILKNQFKYRALNKFKRILQLNDIDINVYHYGMKLREPSAKIKQLYLSIDEAINHVGLSSNVIQTRNKMYKSNVTYRPATACYQRCKTEIAQDLSFLSKDEDDNIPKEDKNIKKASFLRLMTENEERNLKGYKPPIIKQKPIIRKDPQYKAKTNLDMLLKEQELLKKVNHHIIQSEIKREKIEESFLKKRREQTIITLRGRGFKYNNDIT